MTVTVFKSSKQNIKKQQNNKHIFFLLLLMQLLASPAMAQSSFSPVTEEGEVILNLAGGIKNQDNQWFPAASIAMRLGLTSRIELGTPLALVVSLLSHDSPNTVALALGVNNFKINKDLNFFWTPCLMLASKIKLGTSASGLFATDFSALRLDLNKETALYYRVATALMINMGPYMSIALGISSTLGLSKNLPEILMNSNLMGESRISIGSVRVTPFEDIPTINIKLHPNIAFILITRLDIDTDKHKFSSIYLAGLRTHL